MALWGHFVLLLASIALPQVEATDTCQCLPGATPAYSQNVIWLWNSIAADLLPIALDMYHAAPDCQKQLWREAFILASSWEANHDALGRYTRNNASLETYFVTPTYCAMDDCVNSRLDWAKNAFLDVVILMGAAEAAVLAGKTQPKDWFVPEQFLGNLQEFLVDALDNGAVWTYCPTTYNPIAPWHLRNMTLLPQLVWIDLPNKFIDLASNSSCVLDASPTMSTVQQHIAGLYARKVVAGLPHADGSTCAASAKRVSAAFGEEFASRADKLSDDLKVSSSKQVLGKFASAAPPFGTWAGLHEMTRHAADLNFHTQAGKIWDALTQSSGSIAI